ALLSWTPWQTVPTPTPKLPVRPLDLRQKWHMTDWVVPLEQVWRRLPSEDSIDSGESEWEPPASLEPRTSVGLVRPLALHVIGVMVSCVLVLTWLASGIRGHHARPLPERRQWRVRFLLGWMTLSVLGTLWLPPSIRPAAAWPA